MSCRQGVRVEYSDTLCLSGGFVLSCGDSVGSAVPVSQRHVQQQLELGIGVWVCVVHAGYVLRVSWSDSAYGSLQGESCSM